MTETEKFQATMDAVFNLYAHTIDTLTYRSANHDDRLTMALDDLWVPGDEPPEDHTETLVVIKDGATGDCFTTYALYSLARGGWCDGTLEGEILNGNNDWTVVAWMRRIFPAWVTELLGENA